MVSPAPTKINAFGLGGGNTLWWKYKGSTPNAWTPWQSGGPGSWLYEPITISRAHNEISVFMVDKDGTLHQSNFDLYDTGDLGPWKNLGGNLIGPPALAKRHAGIIHIFYIGKDHGIHHRTWDGLVYSPDEGYEKLEGEFAYSPTAVSTGRHDVSVFGIGLDNCLYHYQWKSSSGWGSIEKLPGHWVLSPKAVSDQPGNIDVFGIDSGGNITHVFCINGKDWQLETLPGTLKSVDAISLNPGCIDIVALSEAKTIFHRTLKDGLWLEWENLNGVMDYPPTVVSEGPGELGVLCVNEGTVVFFKARDAKTGSWTQWYSLEGGIISRMS